MKKACFIMGSIEIIVGVISLHLTMLIAQIVPKIANIYYMIRLAKFTKANYIVHVEFINVLSICLCVLGIVSIICSIFIKDKKYNIVQDNTK